MQTLLLEKPMITTPNNSLFGLEKEASFRRANGETPQPR